MRVRSPLRAIERPMEHVLHRHDMILVFAFVRVPVVKKMNKTSGLHSHRSCTPSPLRIFGRMVVSVLFYGIRIMWRACRLRKPLLNPTTAGSLSPPHRWKDCYFRAQGHTGVNSPCLCIHTRRTVAERMSWRCTKRGPAGLMSTPLPDVSSDLQH